LLYIGLNVRLFIADIAVADGAVLFTVSPHLHFTVICRMLECWSWLMPTYSEIVTVCRLYYIYSLSVNC